MAEVKSLDPGPSKRSGGWNPHHNQETAGAERSLDYEYADEDTYMVGKAYFDVKEFDRAAIALKPIRRGPGRFLRHYARFLGIEKRINDISGPPLGRPVVLFQTNLPFHFS
jgi:hypothetical protein